MRTVTQADVNAVARRLWAMPRADWGTMMHRALTNAHAADLYRKRFGRLHPVWGNGSLGAVFQFDPMLPPEPFWAETCFLEATSEAINAIVEWRKRQNVKI